MITAEGKRALAYTARIGSVEPIEGADRIEKATIGGWTLIVKKDEFKAGDLCVYFEIDSKLPEKPWSEFLKDKHYAVKIYKLNKFKIWGEGLALPLSSFDIDIPEEENIDLTDKLGVTYYVTEDNARKSSGIGPNAKYISMNARHKNLSKKKIWKWLMKRSWGRKLLFTFFGKKKDNPKGFPNFINKTDEERVENMPWVLNDREKVWLMTEKLDGTSSTYALKKIKGLFGNVTYDFIVCSRNVRQIDENQETYHDHNIYWDMAFKYNIRKKLEDYVKWTNCDWVAIQGEAVGSVQGNPLQLKEDDLYVFNFIDSIRGRFPSETGNKIIRCWGMKWVPILGTTTLPDNMEDMKLSAEGNSVVNPNVLREGIVYRSLDGKESFKNVARSYLLKHSN